MPKPDFVYEVEIDSVSGLGCFTDNKYGDEGNEGKLRFDRKVLFDADGVIYLPKQVVRCLRALGFIVPDSFCCE